MTDRKVTELTSISSSRCVLHFIISFQMGIQVEDDFHIGGSAVYALETDRRFTGDDRGSKHY